MTTYTKEYNPTPMDNPELDSINNEKDSNNRPIPEQNQEYFLRENTTSPIYDCENINKTEYQNEYNSKVSKQKQVLNAYIYDFLLKSNHKDTAISFYKEADIIEEGNRPIRTVPNVQVPPTFVPKFNTKQSYLFEWWLIFWDLFNSKSNRAGSVLSQHYYQILLKQRQYEQGFRNVAVNAARQQFLAEVGNEFNGESLDIFEFLSMLSPNEVEKRTSPKHIPKNSNHSSVSTNSSTNSSTRANSVQHEAYMQTLQQKTPQQPHFQKPIPRRISPTQQYPYTYPYPPPYQYSTPSIPVGPPPYPAGPQVNPYIPSQGPTPIPQNYPQPMGVPPPPMSLPNSSYPESVPHPSSTPHHPCYYYPPHSRSYSQLNTMNPYTQQQLYEQELLKQQYPSYQRMQLQRAKSAHVVSDKRDHFPGSSNSSSRSNLVPILENQYGERSNSPKLNATSRPRSNTSSKDLTNKNKITKAKNKVKKSKYSRKSNQKVSSHAKNVLNKQKDSETDTPKSETITPRPSTMSQIFGNPPKISQDSSERSSITSEDNSRSNSLINSNKLMGVDLKSQSVSDPVSPWEHGSHHIHQQQRQHSRLASLRQLNDSMPLTSDHHSVSSVSSSSKSIRDLPYQNNATTMDSVNMHASPTNTDNSMNDNGSRNSYKPDIALSVTDDSFKYNENEDLLFFDNMLEGTNQGKKSGSPQPSKAITESKSNASEKDSNNSYPHRNILDMDPGEYFNHYST